MDLDCDEEADVLYISFDKPREAEDSFEVEEGEMSRIAGNEIISITITKFKATTNEKYLWMQIKRAV